MSMPGTECFCILQKYYGGGGGWYRIYVFTAHCCNIASRFDGSYQVSHFNHSELADVTLMTFKSNCFDPSEILQLLVIDLVSILFISAKMRTENLEDADRHAEC